MAITKAVVLCAGEGTRLRPLTSLTPKHLMPVAGKPLLGWILEDLAAAGIKEVGLVVGFHFQAIREYVWEGSRWGVAASYLTQEEPRGLADAVNTAREFADEEPFMVYLGDNILECGLAEFLSRFEEEEATAGVVAKEVDDPRQYGVIEMQEGRVVRLVEKPAHPPSNLAIVGVYAFTPLIFEAIDSIEPSARGEYEITDAIQWLLDNKGGVIVHQLAGFWEDAGRPEDLLRVNQFYLDRREFTLDGEIDDDSKLEGNVGVGADTRITGSRMTGPVIIGDDCVIEHCRVGPYVSVDDGCHLANSSLRNCIIQQNCQIRDLTTGLVDSVLGQKVEIVGVGTHPGKPLSMIVGDMSRIHSS